MKGANNGAAAETDAAEEEQVLKGDLAAFARLSNEQRRQLHTLDLSRTQQYNANNPPFEAEGAASLALQLKHLGQLQSLDLTCKQQGSDWCAQRVGLGGRGWYLRGSPVAALCSVGVLGAEHGVCAGIWGF